jgi:hypothetical protein
MNAPNETEFLVAVELNNIGTQLMDLGAYYDAMEVMKHAITAMKHVVQPEQDDELSTPYHQSAPAPHDPRLQSAHKTLHTVQHFTSDWSHHTIERDSFSTPIPIEATQAFSLSDESPDMPSAIMLYNYGLVHRAFSHHAPTKSERLLDGALKLFQMAYTVLTDHKPSSCMNYDEMSETRLLLTYFVVNNMLQIQQEIGNHVEAHVALQRLSRLGMAVMLQEQRVEHASCGYATGAPAA